MTPLFFVDTHDKFEHPKGQAVNAYTFRRQDGQVILKKFLDLSVLDGNMMILPEGREGIEDPVFNVREGSEQEDGDRSD